MNFKKSLFITMTLRCFKTEFYWITRDAHQDLDDDGDKDDGNDGGVLNLWQDEGNDDERETNRRNK